MASGIRQHFKMSPERKPRRSRLPTNERRKARTFGNTLAAVAQVAGGAGAAEAGGEVPALRVHGALVPAVGAGRAGVRVVAEHCGENRGP